MCDLFASICLLISDVVVILVHEITPAFIINYSEQFGNSSSNLWGKDNSWFEQLTVADCRVKIKHITATVWAVNYTQIAESKSSKLLRDLAPYEQHRGGSLRAVWAVKWGVDFYGGAGVAIIKTLTSLTYNEPKTSAKYKTK